MNSVRIKRWCNKTYQIDCYIPIIRRNYQRSLFRNVFILQYESESTVESIEESREDWENGGFKTDNLEVGVSIEEYK